MPIWIASLGPKRTMIGFFQKISIMKSSRTGEDLFTMANYAHRPSRIRERQTRYDLNIQALPSLMAFLGKKSRNTHQVLQGSIP